MTDQPTAQLATHHSPTSPGPVFSRAAVEAGVGGWEPTHLETVGYGAGVAATATSVYWLMMTVGRFLVAPLACGSPPRPSSPSRARA